MMAALSRPSGGIIEADGGEVQSKGPMEAGPGCPSWTNEKHMTYLSSLEESFMSQLNGSPFHHHLMNMLGRSGTKQRQSESSITTETLSDSSQSRILQQGCRENLKFVKTKLGLQKGNTSFSLSGNQWVKHFEPNFKGQSVNIREKYQGVDQQSSYSGKSVKRERCCCSKELSSQDQLSFSSQNGDGYGEVSDQNFVKEDITGAESSQTYKKKRLNSPVLLPLIDQVGIGKEQMDAIIEKNEYDCLDQNQT